MMTPEMFMAATGRTDLKDYAIVSLRICDDESLKHTHYAMGMVTEAGEFMDALKKSFMYGKPLDRVNLAEEIGDLLWYVARELELLNFSFEEVMQMNINKLQKRFPEKFEEGLANNRDLQTERNQLEIDFKGEDK